jgi:hypothetical protein
MKKKIWTYMKLSFMTMGGDLRMKPRHIMVDAKGPFDLGKGFKAYTTTAPNGKTVVFCAKSKGIIGYDLDKVKKDVADGEIAVMKTQVSSAAKESKTSEEIDVPSFWQKLGLS